MLWGEWSPLPGHLGLAVPVDLPGGSPLPALLHQHQAGAAVGDLGQGGGPGAHQQLQPVVLPELVGLGGQVAGPQHPHQLALP